LRSVLVQILFWVFHFSLVLFMRQRRQVVWGLAVILSLLQTISIYSPNINLGVPGNVAIMLATEINAVEYRLNLYALLMALLFFVTWRRTNMSKTSKS